MNIYSKKQQWKLILFVIAVLIVGTSLWYTNTLVKKIANEEREQVHLWADAIQKKAKLVKYTSELFKKISNEERKKVELWAEATKQLATPDDLSDYSFVLKVVADNTTVPVILTDEKKHIISYRNLNSDKVNDENYLKKEMQLMASSHQPIEINIYQDKKNYLYYKDSKLFTELKQMMDDIIKSFISEMVINSASVPVIFADGTKEKVIAFGNIDSTLLIDIQLLKSTIASMESQNDPIEIDLGDGNTSYIFYQDSFLLTQLKYYPFAQFGIIGLFLLIAYLLFSTARKAEQNQVWVGMAKETAHQLGTPLSSLIAWVELLKEKNVNDETVKEINKDITRLETITERFSKIGSVPTLKKENVLMVLNNVVSYMKTRISDRVHFFIQSSGQKDIFALLNVPLFDWVIENLCKNATDAMNGTGTISVTISEHNQWIHVDISDTGKGIPATKHKTIFEPGYTSKQRGWGLGLSLAKRIIENYHFGKIFVKHSEIGKGASFRIILRKAK